MRPLSKLLIAVLLVALLAGLAVLVFIRSEDPADISARKGEDVNPRKIAHEDEFSKQNQPSGDQDGETAAETLLKSLEKLKAASGAEMEFLLKRTALQLDAIPTEQAEEAILAELNSGRDTVTGLPFVAGEDELTSVPTWRVFLLDRLGRLNPRLAAEYARRSIFPSSSSAEEWAISLRNVLHSYPPRGELKSRAEISGLLVQMLARPDWRTKGAEGLLESLDFVAHSSDPVVHLAALNEWVGSGDENSLAAAAQIAVERTMEKRGDDLLPAMASKADLADNGLRASAMARADLRKPAQAEAVAEFLRNQPTGSSESGIFFRAFPLHHFSAAPGLAGMPTIPDSKDLLAADLAALAMVEGWVADPSMSSHRDELFALAEKLGQLTGTR